MKLHVDTVHGANKYVCPVCPTSFTRKFSLQRHIYTAHSEWDVSNVPAKSDWNFSEDVTHFHS